MVVPTRAADLDVVALESQALVLISGPDDDIPTGSSGAHVQRIVPESYLHVAAVSRRTHLTAPATALMNEARQYANQAKQRRKAASG